MIDRSEEEHTTMLYDRRRLRFGPLPHHRGKQGSNWATKYYPYMLEGYGVRVLGLELRLGLGLWGVRVVG